MSTLKLLPNPGSKASIADKFSVPASAADALSRSRRAGALSEAEWAEPLIVILPNWPAAVPPISIATLPPAKWVNPPDIFFSRRRCIPAHLDA